MPEARDTKRMFSDELEAMMRTVPLSKVRVRDLCDRCGVERCTFYYHFRDKYDLVAWMLDQDNGRAMQEARAWTRAHYAKGLQLIWERRGFYRLAYEEDSQNSIYRHHLQYCIESNEALLRRLLDAGELPREAAFEARFFSMGVVGCLASWLRGDFEATPEQLADSMFDAMSPLIRKAYAAHEVGKG